MVPCWKELPSIFFSFCFWMYSIEKKSYFEQDSTNWILKSIKSTIAWNGLNDIFGSCYKHLRMLDILFWISIFSGGTLLLLFILSFVGGLDLDVDIDLGSGDVDTDAGGVGWVKGGLIFISIGCWVFRIFLLLEQSTPLSLTAGIVAGLLVAYVLSKLVRFLISQTEDNTWDIEDTIGSEAKVYLKIPTNGNGIVQVNINGAIHDLKAITKDDVEIATGAYVRINDVENGLLVVTKIKNN